MQIPARALLAVFCAGGCFLGRLFAADASDEGTPVIQAGTLGADADKVSQAGTLYALALSRDSAGDRAGAIALLRQVAGIDPAFAQGQIKLASLLLADNQVDAAYGHVLTAQANHGDQDAVNLILAQVDNARGDADSARRLAENVLAHNPTSSDAMRLLLQLGEAQHDLESAAGRVTERLSAGGAPVDSYLALVKIYLDLTGQENPAPDGVVVLKTLLGIYQVAEKIAPENVDLLSVLSDTYNQLGQNDQALAALLRAQKAEPHDLDLMMRIAAAAADAGDKDEELHQYQLAYAIDPQRVRGSLATTYFENQQYDKALDMMKRMLADSPHDPMLLIRLGVTCEALQKMKEAHGWFVKATDSPALTLDAALKLAAYFIDAQRGPEATPVIAAGIRLFPSSPDLHFYAAVQALGAGRTTVALEEYEKASHFAGNDPSSMGVNFYLAGAGILGAAGHNDQIDPLLREGLQRYPDDPNLLNQEAWEWTRQGRNLDQALAAAQKAASLTPDNGQMQDTLGCVYLRMNQPDRALPVLQQAAKMTNNDPSVLQHLGDTYLARGLTDDALAAWRMGLQKDPANRDLTQRLQLNERTSQHASSSPASP